METAEKSTLFIKNGYCCGHGQVVLRLENWCIANKIPYKVTPVRGISVASYEDKTSILAPQKTIPKILAELGL